MTDKPQDTHHGKQAQHTPGPWAYWEPQTDNGKWQIDAASGPMLPRPKIATVHTKLVGSEANARLIAASPDLLKALEAALSWFESPPCPTINGRPVSTITYGPASQVVIENARAAIRAATGLSNRDEAQQNSEAIVPEPFPGHSHFGG